MSNIYKLAAASLAITLIVLTPADAKRHRHRGGGLVCGAVQMSHFGIRDQNFRLAKHWATLPHTSAHEGAVVVQHREGRDSAGNPGGHVSRIVQMKGNCSALVADDKGTYVRDICSRLIAYVDANGNNVARADRRERHQFSARRHRHHHRVYANVSRQQEFVPVDRYMIH